MILSLTPSRIAFATLAAVVVLWPFVGAQACGPDFEPDLFVQSNSPDSHAAFARGELGLLQRGYDSNEYAVAYRYLNGSKLSEAERRSYDPPGRGEVVPPEEESARRDAQPPNAWLLKRADYVPALAQPEQEKSFPKDYAGNIVFDPDYLNCPNPAIENATLTLTKRAETWGKQSPWLVDWIHGQDAVFANCTGKSATLPEPAPAKSPALLLADRAYQLASASFYARQYDQAAEQFTAIAHDKSSPWNSWGEYLAARATVRKAFATGKATDPYGGELATFDLETMRKAQQMFEATLQERNPLPSRKIVLDELNFVRIRTESEKRTSEICAALAGPGPDDNFAQDLADLDFVLAKHIAIPNPPPLLAWIQAFRSGDPKPAFALWQKDHALPWLVISLVNANASDAFSPQLLDAAAKIKTDSPAYDTVFYHRVRLLIGLKRIDEARTLLAHVQPAQSGPPPVSNQGSNQNALLGERLAVAHDFNEFLAYAPRKVILPADTRAEIIVANCSDSMAGIPRPEDCPPKGEPPPLDHSLEFDQDAVDVLNRLTPIDLLVRAASSPNLPPNLRRDLVLATWTRSVVLDDQASAAKLVPLLPKAVRDTAGSRIGFPATLAILRNPGLRPYLEPGASRFATFHQLDSYRDNWWSSWWLNQQSDQQPGDTPKSAAFPPPAIFTKEQQSTGEAQFQRLQQSTHSAAFLGHRVLDYAKDHPDDPRVPEALALTVRATHYGMDTYTEPNTKSETTAVSKAAFEMLHKRYPKSPWTLRTRYYY